MSELATKKQGEIGLAVNDALAMMGEMPGLPEDVALPELKISREALQFQVDGEFVKSFSGVVLHWHNTNTFWEHEYGSGETAYPTCLSVDGVKPAAIATEGYQQQAETCAACPFSQWDTGKDGVGKACPPARRLYILRDGHAIPSTLRVPATSLRRRGPLNTWHVAAVNETTAKYGRAVLPIVHTEFSLARGKSASGFETAILTPRILNVIEDPHAIKRIAEIRQAASKLWATSDLVHRALREVPDNETAASDGDAPS